MKYSIELPIKIESVMNLREHWRRKHARAKMHRRAAMAVYPRVTLPCIVTLTRIAPRPFDGDNLQSGFKALRDGIADRLGVDDADPRVEWRYAQERGGVRYYAARVDIQARITGCQVSPLSW